MSEKIILNLTSEQISVLFGNFDENINKIQNEYNVSIVNRSEGLKIIGEPKNIEDAEKAVKALVDIASSGQNLSEQTVRYVTSMVADGAENQLSQLTGDGVCVTAGGKIVRPRTVGQKKYIESIGQNTIVLGIGPAGTGKTYLAVAMAVKAFRNHEIKKIILTRPAVEAAAFSKGVPGLYI